MPRNDCPPPIELARLFLGGLAEQEAEVLEQHLLHCPACLAMLQQQVHTRDRLAAVLREDGGSVSVACSAAVEAWMANLKSWYPASPSASHQGAVMRTIACPACQKKMAIPEKLAGKKIKCPACAQVLPVPALAPAPVGNEEGTRPPATGLAPASQIPQTLPPADVAAGSQPTFSPLSKACPTAGVDTVHKGHDARLTDFLSPPQSDDELGRLGKYRILKILGHGGMGVVFQAEDPLLERLVALKAMLPALAASASAGQRFLREARSMAAVENDHVVRVYQVDEERGVPFLAMELLKGEPLDGRLKREHKLPVTEVLRVGREIARGLSAAHKTGLIHRDIKPGNIWLEAPEDRVKILDFGLARGTSQDAGLTQQGAIIGTPAYMAPEQGRGEAVDAHSDLFSLGVVLYRLCCGKQPFKGKDTVSTLLSVATDEPTPPSQIYPDLPQELSDLVMQLLAKEPAQRPASADAVVQTLHALEKKLAGQHQASNDTLDLQAPPLRRGAAPPRRWLPVLLGALMLLAGLIGVGAWALIRIQTDQGDYVIDTDDPAFFFQVNKEGGVTLEDRKANRKYTLKVLRQEQGEWQLEATDAAADLSFKTKTFTIRRGQQVALKAWFERKAGPPAQQPVAILDDAWHKQVAALSPAQQVAAVAARLKERNPGFDGKVTHEIEDGVVTELGFVTDKVTDISPVRALTGLRMLRCNGSGNWKGQLADLSPLKDMKLTYLECLFTKVSHLTPLKDMKLTYLNCQGTQVSDLSPLKDMKLTKLDCSWTQVSDLAPLKDMKLTGLNCSGTQVSDLSLLKDMKLTALHCKSTPVTDLLPLKDMKLTYLNCQGTQVSDLSPLKDMKLTNLWCDHTQVSDLSPLKDMKLRNLICGGTKVTDLTPLKNMKLTSLWCNGTQVTDLSPLKDMRLTQLGCWSTKVTDLSPLKGMPLKELQCDFKAERDAEILRSIKTLEKINDKSAQDFWKEVDARKLDQKP